LRILAGRYRLVAPLGRGGMASVWKAEHLTLRSPVAIKLIDPAIASDRDALARFYREAQAAAALRSPHVVQVLDYGLDQGPFGETPFIAMELLEGEPLSARLLRERTLSPQVVGDLFTQVARAIARAHDANIVHRDLKPDNVFLVKNEDQVVAKVLDFGIAKAHLDGSDTAKQGATETGAVLGTPFYMSPEQAEGLSGVNFRTDIWSFGVMAYECLLGCRPFTAPTPAGIILAICAREPPVPSRMGSVPAGFDAWFATACARDPERRFPSVRDAAAELRRLCAPASVSVKSAVAEPALLDARSSGKGSSTSPPVMSTRPPRVASARTKRALTATLIAAGAALVGAVLWQRSSVPSSPAARREREAPSVAPPPPIASTRASVETPVPVSEVPAPAPEEPRVFPVASAPPPAASAKRAPPAATTSVAPRPSSAAAQPSAQRPAPVKHKTSVNLGL